MTTRERTRESLRRYLGDDRLVDADGSILPISLLRAIGRRVWWQVWPWYLLAAAMYLYLLRRGNDPLLTLLLAAVLYAAIVIGYRLFRTPNARGHILTVGASTELCSMVGAAGKLRLGGTGSLIPTHSLVLSEGGLLLRLKGHERGQVQIFALRELGVQVCPEVSPFGLIAGCDFVGPNGSCRVRATGRLRRGVSRDPSDGSAGHR